MDLEEILLEGAAQRGGSGDGMFWGVIEGSPPKLRKRGEDVALEPSASAEPEWKLWPGQKVLCYQQGSQRIIVKAMDEGTGFAQLTLSGGWDSPNGWPVRVRRRGPVAQLEGLLIPPSDAVTQTITTIPAWARPAFGLRFTTHAQGNRAVGALEITSTGFLRYNTAWWPTVPSGWLHVHTTWLAGL